MSGKIKIIGILLILFLLVAAKVPDYWRFPINTDEIKLAGTFGELRESHFHAGIDIKTNGQSGMPVYAVQNGYVYRIKITPDGYGKALYLRNDDGKFAVYAHLSQYNEEIEEIVYQKQYASKKYDLDIYLPSNRLPVKYGDLVAYSGNTGHSAGPHLHFEVRDENDRLFNPLKYYSSRISDRIPPVITSFGVEPLDTGSYVAGKTIKQIFKPVGGDGNYRIPELIYVCGRTGLEFTGYDFLDAAPNKCGINFSKLFLDGKQIFSFSLDHFNLDEKKYINLYFDYAWEMENREMYQRLYIEDGNQLDAYPMSENHGIITLTDDRVHDFRIELSDVYGNVTRLSGQLMRFHPWELSSVPPQDAPYPTVAYSMRRDILEISIDDPLPDHLKGIQLEFDDDHKEIIKPGCFSEGKLWYFYKISADPLPDHVYDPVSRQRVTFNFVKTIYPGQNNIAQSGDLEIFFPFGSVYDTLGLEVKRLPGSYSTYSQVYRIGDPTVPLHQPFVVRFRPERPGDLKYMVVAQLVEGKSWVFCGKTLREDGSLMASPSSFGDFSLMADSTAPMIEPFNFKSGQSIPGGQKTLELKVWDNFSGIESERLLLRLDQEWILGEFDSKTDRLVHPIVKRPSPGYHTLEVNAWDGAGNLNTRTYSLMF